MKGETINTLKKLEGKMRDQTTARISFLIDAAVALNGQHEQELLDALMEEVFSLEEEFLS